MSLLFKWASLESLLTLLANMSSLGIGWSMNVTTVCFNDDVIDKADVNQAGTRLSERILTSLKLCGDFVVSG